MVIFNGLYDSEIPPPYEVSCIEDQGESRYHGKCASTFCRIGRNSTNTSNEVESVAGLRFNNRPYLSPRVWNGILKINPDPIRTHF